LSLKGKRMDLTKYQDSVFPFSLTIKKEITISPNAIGDIKTKFHEEYIREWIKKLHIPFEFYDIWAIRENCIKALSGGEYSR
jgi:hypothetical protein